jgi:DNA-directed RNA polymerase subunit alpha
MHTKELKRPKRLMADPEALTYNYGKFIAEPLSRGFGITLGNSLRRILLSALKGAAITAIKIDGVLHEFDTVPGVVEDVTQIVLNLKEIRFKLFDDGPVTLYLDVKGSGEVTAADIQPNSRIEIMNPDQHIATLDTNGALSMEIYVDTGRGYVSAELNKDEEPVLGVIPVDSIFSPIRKVNFQVEDMREEMADYDRLFLEVWTDGTINAKDAIADAAKILVDHLGMFVDFDETYVEEAEEVDEELERRKAYLSKPVAELELSVRSANCLEAADIITIRDLVTRSEPEMLKFRNFGRKSLNEIKTILGEMGLSFGMILDGDEPVITAEEPTDAS